MRPGRRVCHSAPPRVREALAAHRAHYPDGGTLSDGGLLRQLPLPSSGQGALHLQPVQGARAARATRAAAKVGRCLRVSV
eukprot:2625050-Alexandrium_andersonii.AAC.1